MKMVEPELAVCSRLLGSCYLGSRSGVRCLSHLHVAASHGLKRQEDRRLDQRVWAESVALEAGVLLQVNLLDTWLELRPRSKVKPSFGSVSELPIELHCLAFLSSGLPPSDFSPSASPRRRWQRIAQNLGQPLC